ncbi:MAG: type II toxin-antitoxin system PemK/MazF family toxin [Deltaproteobacteria bacterium]|nr:type II toxin-antitoxin system PemK/MazF family toxin [Deltaproteobacteria bacterium]
MPSYSKNEVVLVRYPFSDLTSTKVRPAVIANTSHSSQDILLVPLTSKTTGLLAGEFMLADWKGAGLNVETAAKRGIFTIHERLVLKRVGRLITKDAEKLEASLREWLGLH